MKNIISLKNVLFVLATLFCLDGFSFSSLSKSVMISSEDSETISSGRHRIGAPVDGYYPIYTAKDLQDFGYMVAEGNNQAINAKLMNDIDCSSISEWFPIGVKLYDQWGNNKTIKTFKGTIDGGGYTIKNLKMDKNNPNYPVGLVSQAGDGMVIKDLFIDSSCSFKSNSNGTAAFVGKAVQDNGNNTTITIENCGNESSVQGQDYTAAFIGDCDNVKLVITNCYNMGNIKGSGAAFVGGRNFTLRSITNCWSSGSLNGNIEQNFTLVRGNNQTNVRNSYDLTKKNEKSNYPAPDNYTDEWLSNGKLIEHLSENAPEDVPVTWIQDEEKNHPVPTSDPSSNPSSKIESGIYERTDLTPGEFFTICLPWPSTSFEGAEIYSIAGKRTTQDSKKNSTSVSSLVLTDAGDKIKAGEPYICRAIANTFTVNYSGKKVKEANTVNGLCGKFVRFPFKGLQEYKTEVKKEKGGFYVLVNNTLKFASEQSGVVENRAFVIMSKVPNYERAGVKALSIDFEMFTDEDDTSAIVDANVTDADAPVFNLQGQRVLKPSHGLFIMNGKKVIIK